MIKKGNEESIKVETKISLTFATYVEVEFSIETEIRKKAKKGKCEKN